MIEMSEGHPGPVLEHPPQPDDRILHGWVGHPVHGSRDLVMVVEGPIDDGHVDYSDYSDYTDYTDYVDHSDLAHSNWSDHNNVVHDDYADYDNIIMTGGTLFKYEGYVTANITLSGSARCVYNSADVLSTKGVTGVVYVNTGAQFDLSKDERAKVIAAVELSSGSTWLDPYLCVTYDAAPKLKGCKLRDVTLDLGSNISVAPTAI